MYEGITYAVLIYTCCDIVSYSLYPFIGISHCDTDTGCLENCHVIATITEGNTFFQADTKVL